VNNYVYVTSGHDHANGLLNGASENNLNRLQVVHKTLAKSCLSDPAIE
jgi:hypothetical protein